MSWFVSRPPISALSNPPRVLPKQRNGQGRSHGPPSTKILHTPIMREVWPAKSPSLESQSRFEHSWLANQIRCVHHPFRVPNLPNFQRETECLCEISVLQTSHLKRLAVGQKIETRVPNQVRDWNTGETASFFTYFPGVA